MAKAVKKRVTKKTTNVKKNPSTIKKNIISNDLIAQREKYEEQHFFTKAEALAVADAIKNEMLNSITHAFALGGAVVGAMFMIAKAWLTHDAIIIGSAITFSVTMVILYLASLLYHGIHHVKWKWRMKIFDHSAIYLFIAGCYTPFTLLWFAQSPGIYMFYAIWSIAIAGVIMKMFYVSKSKVLTALPYLIMGWMCLVAVKSFYLHANIFSGGLFIAGGLLYSIGVLFYRIKRNYFHGIWHIFVTLGTIAHFLVIWLYVLFP